MNSIYSVKFMNEASAKLADKVFKKPINETYLFSTLDILREMSNTINTNTEKLYIQISEAQSKEDENKLFANYFYQFKDIFEQFANKINEMKSRMIINIENKIETWEELFKDDSYISNFDKQFSYSGYNFSHMEDANYPRLNLQKIYQKEFDYIGQLMQDSGIGASPSAKLKIIATVSNNFINCSGDKSWIKDLIKGMVDIDEKEINRSYSECIYNALRDKYEINVDKGMLYTCKESLLDYEDIIDAASKMCDNMLIELNKVAENISSYLFRNNDNKLKIKTDTDGIIDRDYRLDTYSMNQLNLFLKNKINQLKKVLNIFSIAIGIKFDTAVDYISQNIDILNMARGYNIDNEVGGKSDDEDNEDIDSVEHNEDSVEDVEDSSDNTDDISNSGVEDNIESNPSDDPDIQDNYEVSDDSSINDNTAENSDSVADYEGEEFDESYLFEAELFELDMLQDAYSMHRAIKEALLLEEDKSNSTENKSSLQKIADNNSNIWDKIVAKLIELWSRFKDAVFINSKSKIEYLKKNEKLLLSSEIKGKGKLRFGVGVKLSDLDNLKSVPDLNYQSLEKDLVDEKTFINAHFKEYYEEDKSISDVIKNKYLGKPYEEEKPISQLEPSVKDAYNFCIHYPEKVSPIKKQIDILERARRVAKDISKVQESTINNDFNQYFDEAEITASEEEKKENQANANTDGNTSNNTDKAKKLSIYFKVCSQVLAAEMTVYTKWFNELYSMCKSCIVLLGGESNPEDKEKKENK